MKYLITTILVISFFFSKAQVDNLSLRKNIFFQDEKTFGIRINNNGWGLDYRRGYFHNLKLKTFWEMGAYKVKHPKEYKFSSYYALTKTFVYGKLNEVYDFKLGYGQQITLFDKKEIGTVEVRMILSAGVETAFLKPIYYEIIINQLLNTIYEKYLPSHQPGLILGKAPYSKGLSELTINPGVYFKLGTSFEHSKSVNAVRSLELGIETSLFLRRLEMMAEVNNPRLIVSLFISYRFGTLMQNKQKKSDI
ncbi:MAG: hypothetical protein JXR68_03340 [Bacteroidales bacterium]|nr:hypothetical protein [Bacteroidales bacterium]